ncbi:MAG: hypothetical protein JXB14_00825 [Candidatus Altiarchaeota archaeon]|nr:hypothetical protein [Candidatus Altiarchaeota archaeon]
MKKVRMIVYLWVALAIGVAVVGQTSMRVGMKSLGEVNDTASLVSPDNIVRMFTNKWVFFGVALYAMSVVFWLGILSKMEMSIAYPLLSLGYVLTALVGQFVLHENRLMLINWFGIFMIIGGVYLLMRA